MRLIDANALELILSNAIGMMMTMAKALDCEDDPEIQMEIKAYTDILNGVKEQQTIEPERPTEPIRCKDCKHWKRQVGPVSDGLGDCTYHGWELVTSNGYCFWAERRADSDD